MPVVFLIIIVLLLLPWICLVLGAALTIFFGEAALGFFVTDVFLGLCRWLIRFVEPNPDNFGVLLLGFFWAIFGMLLALIATQDRPAGM